MADLNIAIVEAHVIDALFTTLEKMNIVKKGKARLTHVPSEDPPKGYGASLAAWARVLKRTEEILHNKDPRYRVLHIDENDIRTTYTKALVTAVGLMTKEIMDGQRALTAEAARLKQSNAA